MGAIVLVISIAVGNSMGNRVLGQIAARAPEVVPTPMISASVDPGGPADQVLNQRHQVLSVATDPGFPDPRITPEPPPPPPVRTAPPTPRSTPTPKPTPEPSDDGGDQDVPRYTSPPLPIPIASHQPGESSDENGNPLPAESGEQGQASGASPQPNPKATLP
jgi:hypothetical protein